MTSKQKNNNHKKSPSIIINGNPVNGSVWVYNNGQLNQLDENEIISKLDSDQAIWSVSEKRISDRMDYFKQLREARSKYILGNSLKRYRKFEKSHPTFIQYLDDLRLEKETSEENWKIANTTECPKYIRQRAYDQYQSCSERFWNARDKMYDNIFLELKDSRNTWYIVGGSILAIILLAEPNSLMHIILKFILSIFEIVI